MSERIQPKNNRTFETGKGDWAGDVVWHGDTFLGRQGYISIILEETPAEKTIELAYPAIKPVPGKENTIGFKVHCIVPSSAGFIGDYHLTDGVYSYDGYFAAFFDGPDWESMGIAPDLPADWNIENSVLSIITALEADITAELAFDDFSLQAIPPTKNQYLPIMGIG